MEKRPQLLVMSGEHAGKRVSVPAGGIRIGRSSSNDLHVIDEELSRNHCLFEQSGANGLSVVDLASANGTYVNGKQLGADACELKLGDIVEAGNLVIKIVDEDTPAVITAPPKAEAPAQILAVGPQGAGAEASAGEKPAVDLGLGDGVRGADYLAGETADKEMKAAKRSRSVNILWSLVALSFISLIAVILLVPPQAARQASQQEPAQAQNLSRISEVRYEKVEADSRHILRYEMTIAPDGLLRVVYDDVPGENRHVDKSKTLDEKALSRVAAIFSQDGWSSLENSYSGASAAAENALKSWRIKTVSGISAKEVLVENTLEPEAFNRVREALEAFSRNELGVWALQYSREKLLELAGESSRKGDAKWNDRTVEHGNLAACVAAYKEGLFYLETVNPKPQIYFDLKKKHDDAVLALAEAYRERRFLADKALNLQDWESAKRELMVLMEIVPDRDDERHREAKAKLVDVERRMAQKKGGK